MNHKALTARKLGLFSCEDCQLLSRTDRDNNRPCCPRCGAPLHLRKPQSIARTLALITAAALLYIPANVLPITVTATLGDQQNDTILSGVIYFIGDGSWGVALVIFVASIIIPLAKLLILGYLLATVKFRSAWRPRDRTALYRLTEAVGRWSMVDIYVVTILVALVKLGAVATIEAGPAAGYFAAVVVITMFAARNFDPRLIWDVLEEER